MEHTIAASIPSDYCDFLNGKKPESVHQGAEFLLKRAPSGMFLSHNPTTRALQRRVVEYTYS